MKPQFISQITGVLAETRRRMSSTRLSLVASSLTFATILSVVPLLVVGLAIFQTFGGMERLYDRLLPFAMQYLAEGTSEEVVATLRSFVQNAHVNAIGVGGLIGLIGTSLLMISSVDQAIHRIWRTPITRGMVQRVSGYWMVLTLGPLGLAAVVGLAASLGVPLAAVFVLVFFLIFKWVPSCRVNWRYAFAAAVVVAAAWGMARVGYRIYTERVIATSKIYGGLGAIPIFLVWIYIAWLTVLSGAAFSSVLQKRLGRRRRDLHSHSEG